MGKILRAACSECGFEKDIFEGGGINDCNLDAILTELSENGQKILYEAVQNGAVQISINRIPCSCVSCGNIYAIPIVNYTLNGNTHTVSGQCPECNEEKYASAINCPNCKKIITLEETGIWD
ncbi:MAG: hypothetical protein J6K17_13120 [Oscillospiraceae bacterium]|nr:hypothetical protein [Oscillospiraceae bacterium]